MAVPLPVSLVFWLPKKPCRKVLGSCWVGVGRGLPPGLCLQHSAWAWSEGLMKPAVPLAQNRLSTGLL